eukprot:TRINITY_DN63426_c0_g1_i1.p1 TRINITY_DN63426_c0_g1~~TRINITY_DN63426_c0_g1_i1.p1  ORF type:complete len:178 (-),score=27.90 TRINITY_DN63426_c0_g1_i1:42-575(-)
MSATARSRSDGFGTFRGGSTGRGALLLNACGSVAGPSVHPMLPAHHRFAADELLRSAPSGHRVREMRRLCNEPLASSTAKTTTTPSLGKPAAEYESWSTFDQCKRIHKRQFNDPFDKYKESAITSQEIGWHVSPSSRASLGVPRTPTYGMKQSEATKYRQNMLSTNSEASLRLIIPH